MTSLGNPAHMLAALAIVSRRERSTTILRAIHERAEYRRSVAHNWADAAPIDVNAAVPIERPGDTDTTTHDPETENHA